MAPTSTVQKLESIADALDKVNGGKEQANIYLRGRGHTFGKKEIFFDIDMLKDEKLKDRLRISQSAFSGDLLGANFLWAQDISIPQYTGTVIQKITIGTDLYEKGKKIPTRTVETQVEGFFLKNGSTNIDLQTFKRVFDSTKVDKVVVKLNLEIGAGTYNGKGVTEFTILEEKHPGPVKGKIVWTGKTKFIDIAMTINKDGSLKFDGPWGGVN
jgi:hypothetical protein